MANTEPAELLTVWEAGLGQQGPGRALLLHRAARPEADTGELLSMPVGEREADLFALRGALFGERLEVRIECASCSAAMEFDFASEELVGPPRRPDGPLRVEEDDWVVEFRLPTVADLEAAARAAAGENGADGADGSVGADSAVGAVGADADSAAAGTGAGTGGTDTGAARARRLLLARCTISAVRAGEPVPADRLSELPGQVQRRIAEAAERADPAAEVTLSVGCPECGEATRAELDIASYLWTELDSWARDLLLDVHLLATAYGWGEREIMALSPLRRRYYLELCADA
ncbi:MAG TPA: hypothetical protein DEQ61_24785 [Streptomyces sp.]|nr:hypothetical protein [Streptomyces sp.]